MNQLLQLDIIKLGSLCSLKTYLTKHLATKIVLINFIGIICRIFIKQLTTTIMFINLLLLGKSTIKLIKISRHLYIRKRQAPLEPLISIGCKLLLNYKEAITVLGEVLSKQTQKETLVILNISTEVNIINQRFTIKYNFKILNIELPTYSQLNKIQAYYYKAYKVLLRIKDSWGRIREVTLICYKMANVSPTVTLSILRLKKARLFINCKVKAQ